MLPNDPLVAVVAHEKIPGLSSKTDSPPASTVLTMREALYEEWPTAALLVHYLWEDAKVPERFYGNQPRTNKPALEWLRADGIILRCRFVSFDFDLPKEGGQKVTWNEERFDRFEQLLTSAEPRDREFVGGWHWLYTTPHGFRVIYILETPLEASSYEGFYGALVERWKGLGFAGWIDSKTQDWTRLMRLPCIVRDGRKTSEDPYFRLVDCSERPLFSLKSTKPVLASGQFFGTVAIEQLPAEPDMTLDEAKHAARWEKGETGRTRQSEFWKAAVRALKGRDCLAYINCTKRIEEGVASRNERLYELIGQSIGVLLGNVVSKNLCTPELIWGLWADAVEQLEARTGTDDGRRWEGIAWHQIREAFQKQVAQNKAREEAEVAEQKARVEESHSRLELVVEGMRQWCSHPDLFDEDQGVAATFALRHLIACDSHGSSFYVMGPHGWYERTPVSAQVLPAYIRQIGMDGVIDITTVRNNAICFKDVKQIVTEYGFTVASRVGTVIGEGGWCERLGEKSPVLHFQLFAANDDILPVYHDDIDRYLRAFWFPFYDEIATWVGHSQDFQAPICALSLSGEPGIGKSLMVEGLRNLVDTCDVADAKEITGRFQSGLLRTPWLNISEGLPKTSRDSGQDPADFFRRLISDDHFPVEEKGRGIIHVDTRVRCIITGNNESIIRNLYRHRHLSPQDRDAIAQRVLHFTLTRGGADWLARHGGRALVNKDGEEWVRGPCRLSQHFRWLWKTRPPVDTNSRFLVSGNLSQKVVTDIAIHSAGAELVMASILQMLETNPRPPGIVVDEETPALFVLTNPLCQFFNRHFRTHKPLSPNQAGEIMQGILEPGSSRTPRKMPGYEGKRRWNQIQLSVLHSFAVEVGASCKTLDKLVGDT